MLVGCSSKSSDVRVVDRNNAVAQRPAVTTASTSCDPVTLFSIAFRYGWDYKALAARNNIPGAIHHPSGSDDSLRWAHRFNGFNSFQFFEFNALLPSSKTTVFKRPVNGSGPGLQWLYRPSRTKPAAVPLLGRPSPDRLGMAI